MSPLRTTLVALLAAVVALPVADGRADLDADVDVIFPQAGRLTTEVPVVVHRTVPGGPVAVDAILTSAGREIDRVAVARLEAGPVGAAPLIVRLPSESVVRAQLAAVTSTKADRRPVLTVVAAFREGSATTRRSTRLRFRPFHDGRLAVPDVSRTAARRTRVSVDLAGEVWRQVVGALEGTPAIGSFRRRFGTEPGACVVGLSVTGTTTRRAPTSRGGVLDAPGLAPFRVTSSGRAGTRRWWQGDGVAVSVFPTPAALPGRRPFTVVRLVLDGAGPRPPATCAATSVQRSLRATLRRAATSAIARPIAPSPGPGAETA